MNETSWLPGLLVLGAGALAAVVYLLTVKRAPDDAAATGDKGGLTDDLDAKYQRLLRELKEHLANRHLSSGPAWEQERQRLEQAAAATLRERDEVRHEAHKRAARLEKRARDEAGQATSGATWALRGLGVAAVVGFFVWLGVSVSSPENTHVAPANAGMPTAPQTPATDARLEALASRAAAHPDDVDAVADLATYLLKAQGFEQARPLLAHLAVVDPFEVRGRVGRAVLRAVDGDVPGAQDELETLGQRYPEAWDGFLFAGLLALEQRQASRAVHALDEYLARAPQAEQPPMLRRELEALKAQLPAGP